MKITKWRELVNFPNLENRESVWKYTEKQNKLICIFKKSID